MAYWDTEANPQAPALLGQISGTPTIKALVPPPKGKPSKKTVLDYRGPREAKDMMTFATSNMPNFVERVDSLASLSKFQTKASEFGLPQAILFSKASATSPLIKALSTEYRRKMLIAEVKGSGSKQVLHKFGVSEVPSLLVLKPDDDSAIKYDKDGFTYHKLNNFLGKFALKKPVTSKKPAPQADPAPKQEL